MQRKPEPKVVILTGVQQERSDRINLGLTLLQMCCVYGQPITAEDQAAWTGVSRQAMEFDFQKVMRKVRNKLMFRDRKLWEELKREQ